MNTSIKKKILAILKFAILILLVVGLPLYIYFFNHHVIEQMSSIKGVKAFFARYRTQSVLIYLAAQVVQIVICVIPGQWMQITAGLIWGFWPGYFWSILGAFFGSVITYYLARLLGRDAMHLFFGKAKVEKYEAMFNSKRALVIVFLIYLIPGMPKDFCNYLAGLSELRLRPFLILSLIGRTPGMMISLVFGKQVGTGNWSVAIIIAAIAVALCVIGLIFRKKWMAGLDKIFDKLTR